ncbi:protein arginine methyltransferase NDUFAF7 homolog, mitochondrial [Monomorium pharaonis]|uniref:protein arginine methyltransferase NDUFAF7 homolog, mitochondrial n=1 Tax=Monomorium pharaonis TaxID=307658 RepID=UPI00063F8B81|nr:protein arginine methyltransferase NDUFAF7 homolog, mitochondrial [Monomorium pharaonis]XP_036147924.1 protein arginine methyltransferase NDUFAF7 homolog, mitochondrial [Monomorium pharaonis]XP_036147925.1 protein arginine methyltransferase NDUFAF7 homolog, mitochondrial [Monomorium pharaonis]
MIGLSRLARTITRLTRARLRCSSSSGLKDKTNLYRQLYAKILTCGPITLAEYMKEILIHPTAGYYTTRDVFGRRGDFTTSPEISQLFGEIIAVWIINEWRKISRDPIQLVEFGPGRGTLINDILRVFRKLNLSNKISIHLVEISPALSAIQAEKLCTESRDIEPRVNEDRDNSVTHYREGVTKDGVKIHWYYSVNDVPRKFSVFVAQEFFDALPIHKFQKTDRGWREILIDIVQDSNEERFRYVLSQIPTAACEVYLSPHEKRDHVEMSPQCSVTIDYVSQFLWEHGGFALVIDYGHEREKTDTFRAFRQHKLHDPLLNPGTADLTADVDFLLIKEIAQKDNRLITFGPVTQRKFLKNLNIDLRLKMILRNATKTQKEQIESGYHMITDEDKMGNCFKVLSLFPSVLKDHLKKWPVAGFEDESKTK